MLIVQSDGVGDVQSTVVCPVTSQDEEAKVLRLALEPSATTGLERRSWIMVEKVTALPQAKLAKRIGEISSEEMEFVGAALSYVLGLAR